MWCRACNEEKEPKAFIQENVSPLCRHSPSLCLLCVVEAAVHSKKCPYKGCTAPLNFDPRRIQTIKNTLQKQSPKLYNNICEKPRPKTSKISDRRVDVNVSLLTGANQSIGLRPSDSVMKLKNKISQGLDVPQDRQKLVVANKELSEYKGSRLCRLHDYNIDEDPSVFLLVILYKVPVSLKHVTFDLSWNYPDSGRDYLDATCFVFKETSFVEAIDFRNNFMAPESAITYLGTVTSRGIPCIQVKVDPDKKSISHTGDRMDDKAKIGKHTIDVYLERLPKDVTHLFFTLSAWEHPTIADFPNPTLNFYEAAKPNLNLCETVFNHAKNSSAVIMCSLTRVDTKWRVMASGALSSGNAKDYEPLKEKMKELITEKKC